MRTLCSFGKFAELMKCKAGQELNADAHPVRRVINPQTQQYNSQQIKVAIFKMHNPAE